MNPVSQLDEHPIPFDQDAIDELWENHAGLDGDPPHIDAAHDNYTHTIADHGPWHVFRIGYPFGHGDSVYVWNQTTGTGWTVQDREGEWHGLVNLFAEIVEEEGDCRDSEYRSGCLPSGAVEQTCQDCGASMTVG